MKPIIVGLHNPYSDDPEHALAPYPERSTGYRLWRMLHKLDLPMPSRQALTASLHAAAYKEAFTRYNLCSTQAMADGKTARRLSALKMLSERKIIPGNVVLLLGLDVLDAFGSLYHPEPLERILIHPQVRSGITWRWLPHPSGRSPNYNDPGLRMLAGMLLADLITQSTKQ